MLGLDRELRTLGQLEPFVRSVEQVALVGRVQFFGDVTKLLRALTPALRALAVSLHVHSHFL